MTAILAILASSVFSMLIGFLWYSPFLFGNVWSRLMGFTAKSLKEAQSRMGPLYGLSFLASLITSYVLYRMISATGPLTLFESTKLSLWLWFGFVLPVQTTGEIFSNKPSFSFKLLAINTFYQLTCLLVSSAILNFLI